MSKKKTVFLSKNFKECVKLTKGSFTNYIYRKEGDVNFT